MTFGGDRDIEVLRPCSTCGRKADTGTVGQGVEDLMLSHRENPEAPGGAVQRRARTRAGGVGTAGDQ
jgi:hypothetical protein